MKIVSRSKGDYLVTLLKNRMYSEIHKNTGLIRDHTANGFVRYPEFHPSVIVATYLGFHGVRQGSVWRGRPSILFFRSKKQVSRNVIQWSFGQEGFNFVVHFLRLIFLL